MNNNLNIEGLSYSPDFIGQVEEEELLSNIDQQYWRSDLTRRVQHYGYRYDYKARAVKREDFLGPLPGWIAPLCAKLVSYRFFAAPPDQIIVNEYMPGQGIAPHIDCPPCFGDVIASLSLGSDCLMDFSCAETPKKHSLLVDRRSLLVFKGEARYKWRHGIAQRKSDRIRGVLFPRSRRVSLTFRNVIIGG